MKFRTDSNRQKPKVNAFDLFGFQLIRAFFRISFKVKLLYLKRKHGLKILRI